MAFYIDCTVEHAPRLLRADHGLKSPAIRDEEIESFKGLEVDQYIGSKHKNKCIKIENFGNPPNGVPISIANFLKLVDNRSKYYCICGKEANYDSGRGRIVTMILCTNLHCDIGWFHIFCIKRYKERFLYDATQTKQGYTKTWCCSEHCKMSKSTWSKIFDTDIIDKIELAESDARIQVARTFRKVLTETSRARDVDNVVPSRTSRKDSLVPSMTSSTDSLVDLIKKGLDNECSDENDEGREENSGSSDESEEE